MVLPLLLFNPSIPSRGIFFMTKLRYSGHIQYKIIDIMSKFDILRKRFNQIPVGEKFDFMDLINDLGYSHTTVLGYRSNFETRGYMERISVKLEGSRKVKITFKKNRDLWENVYELQEKRERKQLELWNEK